MAHLTYHIIPHHTCFPSVVLWSRRRISPETSNNRHMCSADCRQHLGHLPQQTLHLTEPISVDPWSTTSKENTSRSMMRWKLRYTGKYEQWALQYFLCDMLNEKYPNWSCKLCPEAQSFGHVYWSNKHNTSFQNLMAGIIQTIVSWVLKPCTFICWWHPPQKNTVSLQICLVSRPRRQSSVA